MDGFAARVAACAGKGSAVAAAAAAREDGAPEQASPPAVHAPQVGGGSGQRASGAGAGAQAAEPSAASLAVLGSEEGEMGRSERRAPRQGVLGHAPRMNHVCAARVQQSCASTLMLVCGQQSPA